MSHSLPPSLIVQELQEQLAAVRRELEEAVQALERKYSGLLSEARLKEETLATKAELVRSHRGSAGESRCTKGRLV